MSATTRSIDALQGTIKATLSVATERLVAALGAEAAEAARRVPSLEKAQAELQAKLEAAEEALHDARHQAPHAAAPPAALPAARVAPADQSVVED